MSDNVINATENMSKRLDREILFNEIVSDTIDMLKNQETTFSPEDLELDNIWEEICYQQQVGESFHWDMYMENLELMIDVAIDDCAKKYKASVSGIIEAIYGEYDEEETDYGEIEADVKEDVRYKILSLAADDECVRKQVDREYGAADTEDMYLSSIAMGMSEEEAKERYYGNAEEEVEASQWSRRDTRRKPADRISDEEFQRMMKLQMATTREEVIKILRTDPNLTEERIQRMMEIWKEP